MTDKKIIKTSLGNDAWVLECFYPDANNINQHILDLIKKSDQKEITVNDVYVNKMTEWNLQFKLSQNFILDAFLNYILDTICNNFNIDNSKLKCSSCWGVIYNEEDYIMPHDHGTSYSFVYYVNVPEGSAPLIFSEFGYKILAEVGKLVLFNGSLTHEVPKNKSKNRICLVGNYDIV